MGPDTIQLIDDDLGLIGAADYATCVFRLECHADQLPLFASPRAARLLGMVGRPASPAFCP